MHNITGKICSAFLIIMGCSAANADYRRIGDGPPLKYALAYCDNLSMGVDRGYFVSGDPNFVGGYALGASIGNAIRRSRFKQNCMVMNGWEYYRPSSKKANVKTNFNSGSNK